MAGVDLNQRIPNNVGLGDDRRLRRALEAWQPAYVDWWEGRRGRSGSRRATCTCAPPWTWIRAAGRTTTT